MILVIFAIAFVRACNYQCSSCDTVDTQKCLSCPPTRVLVNDKCICAEHHQELQSNLKSISCFKCNNNCSTCSFDNPNKCTSCDEATSNRILIGDKCQCQSGYYETQSQYICIQNIDKKIFDLQLKLSKNNNPQKVELQNVKSSDSSSNTLLIETINNSYIYDPAIKDTQTNIQISQLNKGESQKISGKGTLDGEYFPYVDQNLFILAVKQYNDPQGLKWGINFEQFSSQPFQRVVNGRQYQFIIFQQIKQSDNLLIYVVFTDGLPIIKNRRMLETKRFLSEPLLFMQYFSMIVYKSDSILGNPDLNKIVNNFIGLLEVCADCEECEFDNDGFGKCKKCMNDFSYNSSLKKCECQYPLDASGQCFKKCRNSSCVGCVDNVCINCSNIAQNSCLECDIGYYSDGEFCNQCDAQCKTCSSANVCIDCANTYYKENSICIECQSPCKDCLSLSQCNSCVNGYYLSGNRCDSCSLSMSKCILCDNQTQCSKCEVGYYLDTSSFKCFQCPSKCKQCTSFQFCIQCQDGNYLAETIIGVQATCNACPQNCTKCKNSNQCTSCVPGYFEQNYTCQICDSNCKTCYGKQSECYSCQSGKVLIGNTCVLCKSPCLTCDITEEMCTSCIDDTNYLDVSNKCNKCATPCKTCTSKEHCLSCLDGYEFDTLNKRCIFMDPTIVNSTTCISGYAKTMTSCLACPQECEQNCTIVNGTPVCNQCSVGYYISSSSVCQTCQSPCYTCYDSSQCKECLPYYYLNTNKCYSCKQVNCIQCSQNNCLACDKGYTLVSNSCVICSSSVTCCQKGYYGQNCNQCNISCTDCFGPNDNQCFECSKGYYFNDLTKQCKKCKHPSCLECSDYNTCLKCADTSYLSGNQCINCTFPCKSCTSISCSSCVDGYYMDLNNTCQICSADCNTCNNSSSYCTTCKVGYFLLNNACYQCDSNCIECTSFNECSKCKSQYTATIDKKCQLNSCTNSECSLCYTQNTCASCAITQYVSNNTCALCDDNCKSCDTNAYTCTSCENDMYLDSSTKTCKQCASQCLTCEVSSTNCLTCQTQYFKLNNDCQKCSMLCKTCENTSNNCTSCSSDNYLSGTECIPCSLVTNGCKSCSNSHICSSCVEGYYYSNNSCIKCQPECSACTSATICSSCTAIAYKYNATTCKACPSNCTSCTYDGIKVSCQSCAQSYFKSQDQCLPCKSQCLSCEGNENNCTSCQNNDGINTNQPCEICEAPNCKQCSTSNNQICAKCMPGYEIKSNQCVLCTNNCKCNNGYYYDWDQLKCMQCDSSCNMCESSSTNCTGCTSQQYLIDNKCLNCSNPCQSCTSSTSCTSCITGYQLVNHQCQSCSSPCILCDNNYCRSCQDGYFLDSSSQCQSCRSPCSTCSSLTSCHSCISSRYFLKENQCQNCDQLCMECDEIGCTKCNSGYYLKDSTCVRCSDNCLECTEEKCIKCNSPYVPELNICVSCQPHCKFCNSEKCLYCQDSHYLKDGECYPCQKNCTSCTETQCIQCNPKFYIQNSTCISCKPNCQQCDSLTCQQCDDGYYPLQQECRKCADNCLLCTLDSCFICKDGYYSVGKSCNKCQTPCLNCSTVDQCSTCIQKYYLNSDHKCMSCQEGCQQCTSGQDCTLCVQGYYLENTPINKCTKCNVLNCNSCQRQDQCNSCLDGYFLKDNQCKPCSAGCLKCIISNDPEIGPSACLECDKNVANFNRLENGRCILQSICNQIQMFQNEEGVCEQCIENCQKCSSKNSCDLCSESYLYNPDSQTCDTQVFPSPPDPSSAIIPTTITLGLTTLLPIAYYLLKKKISNPDNEIIGDLQSHAQGIV